MKKSFLFIIIYSLILLQISLGALFNKTNSLFGVCSSNIKKFKGSRSILGNYFNSLTYKNIGHVLQGFTLGMLLLTNIDSILGTSEEDCDTSFLQDIVYPLIFIFTITLWQMKQVNIMLPILTFMLLLRKIIYVCKKDKKNLILVLLGCTYIIYNLGKRGFTTHKNSKTIFGINDDFIESSYFSNLFDFFFGATIAIIFFGMRYLYLKLSSSDKNVDKTDPKSEKYKLFIFLLFIIDTMLIIYLINYSSKKFRKLRNKSISEISCYCNDSKYRSDEYNK